jgi:hypothetical protein
MKDIKEIFPPKKFWRILSNGYWFLRNSAMAFLVQNIERHKKCKKHYDITLITNPNDKIVWVRFLETYKLDFTWLDSTEPDIQFLKITKVKLL